MIVYTYAYIQSYILGKFQIPSQSILQMYKEQDTQQCGTTLSEFQYIANFLKYITILTQEEYSPLYMFSLFYCIKITSIQLYILAMNLIAITFTILSLYLIINGVLVYLFKNHLPEILKQAFFYGKQSEKKKKSLLHIIEFPKK